jgi:branched-chain amino acid transport system substrate-binding protein
MPRSIKIFNAIAGVMVLATAFVASAQAADPLRIGVPTDLSGTYATLGDEVMQAIRFAVDEANANGGAAAGREAGI